MHHDGQVVRDSTLGDKPYSLPVTESFDIEVLYYLPYRGDMLVYEVGDGDTGGGFVVRVDVGSLATKWAVCVPGFNLSVGAIEGRFLYQSAIGFVSKLDLEEGVYSWKHDGLYEPNRLSFNAFEPPLIREGEVIFVETKTSAASYKQPRRIIVTKSNGAITIE